VPLSFEQLSSMHSHKTGALIEASVVMGAMATDATSYEQLEALSGYAQAIGLAFQIRDDILDVQSSTEELGKTQGSDSANQKSTYVSILGMDRAQAETDRLYQQSLESLNLFGDRAEPLRALAEFIVHRNY
jgi:geranylgeranyl pyrophosphate synthase